MRTKIRVCTGEGRRVTILVDECASVSIAARSGDVSVRFADAPTIESAERYLGARRRALKRYRALPGSACVSAEMEAAAIRAFLAGADVTRLGRALAAVYEAMEAVRRGDRRSDDDHP